jgi:hypothetical protein
MFVQIAVDIIEISFRSLRSALGDLGGLIASADVDRHLDRVPNGNILSRSGKYKDMYLE